jgi:hypothetical protein
MQELSRFIIKMELGFWELFFHVSAAWLVWLLGLARLDKIVSNCQNGRFRPTRAILSRGKGGF